MSRTLPRRGSLLIWGSNSDESQSPSAAGIEKSVTELEGPTHRLRASVLMPLVGTSYPAPTTGRLTAPALTGPSSFKRGWWGRGIQRRKVNANSTR